MADNFQVLSQMQQQMDNSDPFAMAKSKMPSSDVLSSSMMDGSPEGTPVFSPQGQPPPANTFSGKGQGVATMGQLMTQGGDLSMNDKLMQEISKMDVDSKNIPMSNIGRAVLNNRLQNKFGPGYMQNKDVKGLMAKFDSAMQFYSDKVRENDAKAQANGDRTLAALRGV